MQPLLCGGVPAYRGWESGTQPWAPTWPLCLLESGQRTVGLGTVCIPREEQVLGSASWSAGWEGLHPFWFPLFETEAGYPPVGLHLVSKCRFYYYSGMLRPEKTDTEAKGSVFWPPGTKSRLTGKDTDAGKG